MLTSRNNLSEMRKVLKTYVLKCNGVDRVNTDGLNLNKQKAEKIIGWATNHYLFSCDLPSFNEVPQESVELAVMRLKELETKSKKEPSKTPKDLASDDYEMTFVPSVISAEEIGVKFDDVGALEHVKKALNEIFILPLKRPELFSRGNLLRPCKGLLLFGPPGTGKTLMAKALATESGANFINITPSSLTSMWYGDEENLTRGLFSFARKLAPVIIFVDEVDALLGARGGKSEHEATRRLRNEFMACWDGLTSKDNERILVIGATNRPFDLDDAVIRRMPRRIYVDLPDVAVRLKILKVILAKEELENGFSYEQLAKATESYSGSDLKNLCVAAAYIPVQEFLEEESKGLVCDPVDAVPKLRPLKLDDFIHSKVKVRPSVSYDSTSLKELQDWNDQYGGGEGTNRACLKNLATNSYERSFISGLVRPDEIGVEFKDVGALEDVKKVLEEVVVLPLRRPELFSHGNLLRPCKGMLLFGPPGTGKTLIAKALATEARAHFINVTPSSLGSMWYGEAEKLTKALFTLAVKLAPTIIFLDEIDALLGARGGYENEATRKVRNEFMSAWDGLTSNDSQRILVIGASNRPFDLDDAVIRRMPRRIHVDLPDVKNRLKILEILLAKEALESGFDIKKLAEATEGYSGSDLKNLCVAAAYIPVQELLEHESKGDKKGGTPALRQLKLDDFINSKATVGASVAYESSSLVELREWNERYGEGGSRKKWKHSQPPTN